MKRIDKFKTLINLGATALVFGVIMLLTKGGILNRYQSMMLIPIGYNIIMAVSLNLSAGYLGQLPLGHAGFMSVGGYSSALLTLALDLPSYIEFPIALLFGALVAGLFGIIIGLPALRLRGDYLAIITLGFGEIIRVVITNVNFTGGAFGLRGIPSYTTVTWVFVCMALTIAIISRLMLSRHGRAILAIREDEIAAETSGISTTFYKVATFALSAAFAGLAGGLYAHYICIMDASNFGFMRSVEILVMVVLGGMGSMAGSVVAAIVLTLLPELLRGFADYRMVIYSLLLVLVMIFRPSGLLGRREFSLTGLIKKLAARRDAKEAD